MRNIIVGALLAVGALNAGTIALSTGTTTPNGGNTVQFQGQTDGWEFSISSAITVTDLGIADLSSGLGEAHAIGIWDLGGNLLVSGTVPAGTAAPLLGFFRYVSVASTVLQAGTYLIGAEYDTTNIDFMFANLTTADFSTASPVTFVQNAFGGNATNTLTFPPNTFPGQEDGWFGPNFQFTTSAAVPEPGSIALIGGGLLLLGYVQARNDFQIRTMAPTRNPRSA